MTKVEFRVCEIIEGRICAKLPKKEEQTIMALSIRDAGVKPNQQVRVRGTLKFSAITKKTGEFSSELYPGEKYVVVLANPQVVVDENQREANKELITYIESTFYDSAKYGDKRVQLSTKGDNAPQVFDKVVRHRDGVLLESELASDQEVEVLIRSFKPKKYNNIGVSMGAILIEDANNIQYYTAGAGLSAFGLTADPNAKSNVEPEVFGDNSDLPFGTQEQTPVQEQPTSEDPFATPTSGESNPFIQ